MTRRSLVRRARTLAVVAITVGAVVTLRPARADYEQPNIAYKMGTTLTVNEGPVPTGENESGTLFTPSPAPCQQEPQCRERDIDFSYPKGADPDTPWYVTVSASFDPSDAFTMALYADPNGTAHEVGEDDAGDPLHVALVLAPSDPDQNYGLLMYLNKGTNVPYKVTIASSLQSFPNPYESLNPSGPTSTTAPLAPPPAAPPETTTVPAAETAPSGPPPPVAVTPDSDLSRFPTGSGEFSSGLAPSNLGLFRRAGPPKPAGNPNGVLVAVTLVVVPAAFLVGGFLWLRRRRHGLAL